MQARAAQFPAVTVRMKLQRTDGQPVPRHRPALLADQAAGPRARPAASDFEVIGDGQWHDYRVPVSENRRWSGTVTRLRLDPCNQPDVEVEIDAIRLGP